jgi:hypothetical protein
MRSARLVATNYGTSVISGSNQFPEIGFRGIALPGTPLQTVSHELTNADTCGSLLDKPPTRN